MKKIIYTLVFILAAYQMVNAQVTINNFHKPSAGDRVTVVAADTSNITEGLSGANRTWNFTNAVPKGVPITSDFISPSGTPYASEFPGATLCQRTLSGEDTIFSYNQLTSNAAFLLGQGYDTYIIRYTDTQQLARYPFAYGDTYTDTYYTEYTVSGFLNKVRGSFVYTADAYGSITLPGGTYPALRVKVEHHYTDSVALGSGYYVSELTSVNYVWYTSQHKYPVFSVGRSTFTTGSFTSHYKTVDFTQDNVSGIEQTSTVAPEGFKLKQNYPNPFNPATTINYSITKKGMVTLKVFDVTGKAVASLVNDFQAPGEYKVDFNASGLPSGTYFYKLEMDGASEMKKMTLIK
jgi:hypothetical protein